jgi:hypothetical protein
VAFSSSERTESSSILFWIGAALIGVFSITVIAGVLPIELLKPAWQAKLVSTIISASTYPALGGLFILLSQRGVEASSSDTFARWVKLVRTLAFFAAIGFVLLIPLLASSSVRLLHQARDQEQDVLRNFRRGELAIQAAASEEELRQAIRKLPGSPNELPTLTIPLPQAKTQLLEKLRPQLKQLENASDQLNSGRWQQALASLLRQSLLALCYALGFSALGRLPGSKTSLLQQLQKFQKSVLKSRSLMQAAPRTTKSRRSRSKSAWTQDEQKSRR